MKETYLDIVDDQENIIGKAPFNNAHEKKLLHRAVLILVFKTKEKNEVLIQKRSQKIRYPGKWCLTSGHVDSGQTPLEAAKMEFAEEVLDKKELPRELDEKMSFKFILKKKSNYNDDNEIRYLYETIYDGPLVMNEEVDEQKFVTLSFLFDDIEENPDKYVECTREFLKLYREHELNKNKCC